MRQQSELQVIQQRLPVVGSACHPGCRQPSVPLSVMPGFKKVSGSEIAFVGHSCMTFDIVDKYINLLSSQNSNLMSVRDNENSTLMKLEFYLEIFVPQEVADGVGCR
jgi:hypothetical protein